MRNHLQEVESVLKPHGNKERKQVDEWYLKSSHQNIGIDMPTQRKIAKTGFSFSCLNHTEQRKIWDHIFKRAKTHEAMTQALLYFDKRRREKKLTAADWNTLKPWVNRIDNWAHSDYLSAIYSVLLELFPKKVYSTLKQWNRSNNPWKRRASIVSLIYYADPKRKPPAVKKIFPLLKELLKDNDPYVQKAVGWTLRECGKIYPKETWNFLRKYATKLAAISFSYASEKLGKEKKQKLKQMRKNFKNAMSKKVP